MDEWLLRRSEREGCDGRVAVCHLKKTTTSSSDPSIFVSVAPIHKHTLTYWGFLHSFLCVKGVCSLLHLSGVWRWDGKRQSEGII